MKHSNSEERAKPFNKFSTDMDDLMKAYDHIKFNNIDMVKYLLTFKLYS